MTRRPNCRLKRPRHCFLFWKLQLSFPHPSPLDPTVEGGAA